MNKSRVNRNCQEATESSPHFPCPVTTMIRRRVKPGQEDAYERWMSEITEAAARFDGFLGTTVLRPEKGSNQDYVIILDFANSLYLRGWMTSEIRQSFLERSERLCLADSETETITGLERWFSLPNRAFSQPPTRMKMAILTTVGLYPLLIIIALFLRPALGQFSWPLQILVSVLIAVPAMTWIVMPLLTRLFFPWLYKIRRE